MRPHGRPYGQFSFSHFDDIVGAEVERSSLLQKKKNKYFIFHLLKNMIRYSSHKKLVTLGVRVMKAVLARFLEASWEVHHLTPPAHGAHVSGR